MKCFFSKFWHTQLWFHIKENISTEFDAFCSLSFEKKYISSGVWNIYFVDSFLLPFNLGRVPKIHLLRPEFVIVISYELCILCVKKLFGMRIAPKSSSPSAEEKKEKWLWSSWEWGDGMCVAIYFCIGWNFTWFGDPIKLAYQEWRLNCSVFVDAGDPCMKLMNGVLGKSIPGKRFKLIVLLTLSCFVHISVYPCSDQNVSSELSYTATWECFFSKLWHTVTCMFSQWNEHLYWDWPFCDFSFDKEEMSLLILALWWRIALVFKSIVIKHLQSAT